MALDDVSGIAADGDAFDHVWIESALGEKVVTAMSLRSVLLVFGEQLLRRVLKDFDEFIADDLPLLFRIGYPAEFAQETFGGVNVFEADMEILAENALNHFFFARSEQAVVHKNAGQLIADGLVQ